MPDICAGLSPKLPNFFQLCGQMPPTGDRDLPAADITVNVSTLTEVEGAVLTVLPDMHGSTSPQVYGQLLAIYLLINDLPNAKLLWKHPFIGKILEFFDSKVEQTKSDAQNDAKFKENFISFLQGQLDSLSAANDLANQKNTELQNQINSLASSNNVLKDDYSQMAASKELLTINVASKSSENQRLRASLELCESQKASAFHQIELLEQKIKNLESGENSKCNENQKLRATLELCENQRDSALERVELLENEVKSKKEAFRKLSAELKLEQQSFEMERKTKERLIKENDSLKSDIKELAKKVA
ncbi:hypothetical protein TYRP_009296 [Tyrophagus putrescentiae]|nr:hypothetical protein TYRP_009296 [Tyrophagus putrescentiae]